MFNHTTRLLLLAAALVFLTACDPDRAGGGVPGEITGTVTGYDGPDADVIVQIMNHTSESGPTFHQVGEGTIKGDTLSFAPKPAPVIALYTPANIGLETDQPDLRIGIAKVLLADQSGSFDLGKRNPNLPPDEAQVGDAIAYFLYADRAGTITVPEEATINDGMTGEAALSEGWNVLTMTITSIDSENREQRMSTGRVNDYNWFFASLGDS